MDTIVNQIINKYLWYCKEGKVYNSKNIEVFWIEQKGKRYRFYNPLKLLYTTIDLQKGLIDILENYYYCINVV